MLQLPTVWYENTQFLRIFAEKEGVHREASYLKNYKEVQTTAKKFEAIILRYDEAKYCFRRQRKFQFSCIFNNK